jgi:hypothetical protein
MSLDQHHRQHAADEMLSPVRTTPASSNPATTSARVAIGNMLPPLLTRPGGLGKIPETALKQSLQPVLDALKNLDAEMLLDLQTAPEGPRVREG